MTNDNTNRGICLDKVDSCLSHLDRLRGVVEQDNFIAVENSLHAMHWETSLTEIQIQSKHFTAHSVNSPVNNVLVSGQLVPLVVVELSFLSAVP